jgi:hypothetical protein
MSARSEFLSFLVEASGTHAFALAAIQLSRRDIENLPVINIENPDPIIAWGEGDPNVPGNTQSRPGWRRSEYLENTKRGGITARYLGWAWITLVFDRWEDDFRHRFANEFCCSHRQVVCDVIGDLRYLRHDVTHSKGIATTRQSGKCVILMEWSEIGRYIEVGASQVSQFYDLLANDERAIYAKR